MPGQAIVTIRDKQWQVFLTTTPWELTQGLGGVPGIPPGTGMLFDLGFDTTITITTVPLLFPIDIAFISSTMVVIDIARNVEPGYLVTSGTPARYVLEVNAGELSSVDTGDKVTIQLLALELSAANLWLNWLPDLIAFAGTMLVMAIAVSLVRSFTTAALGSFERVMLPQTEPLKRKWFDKGVEAGKTEGWMNVEETLSETLGAHRDLIKDATDLVWTDIDLWEETDHFNILCGSKMWEDAKGDIDVYSDLKAEFWEGYLTGRKEIGIDIYEKARELLAKAPHQLEFLPQIAGKRGKVIYVADLSKPAHIEDVELHPGIAILKRYGKAVVSFSPTEEQKRKIKANKGRIFIFDRQVMERASFHTSLLSEAITPEQWREAEGVWEVTREDAQRGDVAGVYLWKLLNMHYCDNNDKQIRLVGFINEMMDKYPKGQIPLEEAIKAARKWDVEKAIIKEIVPLLPQLTKSHSPMLVCSICGAVIFRTGEKYYETPQGTFCYHCVPAIYRKSEYEKVHKPVAKRREGGLEYLADSPEFLAQTIEAIGYREKLDQTFREAIRKAKGQW